MLTTALSHGMFFVGLFYQCYQRLNIGDETFHKSHRPRKSSVNSCNCLPGIETGHNSGSYSRECGTLVTCML